MDVAETDQAFEVKLDLPGVKADEADIQIDNNTLTVRGQRSEEKEEKDEEKQYTGLSDLLAASQDPSFSRRRSTKTKPLLNSKTVS